MKLPLLSGAYQARSVIASAQRCVNLYAEKNPEDEEFPTTFYPTPGMKKVATSDSKIWRCLYTSTDGRLFGCVNRLVVEILPDFTFKQIGLIDSLTSKVYMLDNGKDCVVVDGTATGYAFNLETLKANKILNDAFYGSSRVDLIDGYFIFNRPGTQQFYISLINTVDFDALDFASKTGSSDKLVAAISTRRNLFLFGEQTVEVWTNTGDSAFTFSRLSGAVLQFGCASADSIVQADGSIYWLSKSPQGECMVLRTVNYDRERISTFAIENEFQAYSRIDDAFGYVHQMSGHYWYVLTFPTANKTWVYDSATTEWHERSYLLEGGRESRHRANCYAYWNGKHLVGDYENGNLYEMALDLFNDDGNEIRRVRSFPHLASEGHRVAYREFKAAMQVGDGGYAFEPEIRLRWSDTKGASWSTHLKSTLGARGEYLKDCRFMRLGMGRNRVFELSWSADCMTALSGAYVSFEEARS